MGNLRQSNAGVIDAELVLPAMTIDGDNGVIGRAVVVSACKQLFISFDEYIKHLGQSCVLVLVVGTSEHDNFFALPFFPKSRFIFYYFQLF